MRAAGQERAVETVLRDGPDFVTFYHCPKEQWVHLRTSIPIASIFAGVWLRTNATKLMAPGRAPCIWSSSWWSG